MSRSASKVVLVHRDAYSMVDDWIDHIELRRAANATFAVWGNKYGENPSTCRRQWGEWYKIKGLKNPMAIYKAIEDVAEFLNVQVEWVDAILLIASIDWLTAAVIANNVGHEVNALPNVDVLLTQRSLRTFGRVTIGAEWGYDMHELTLPIERWIRILQGERCSIKETDFYEGQRMFGVWVFDGDGSLTVHWDNRIGWEGKLEELDSIEGPVLDDVDLAKLAVSAVKRKEGT